MMLYLRSFLFNTLFYGCTAIACIVLLPSLVLPKKQFLKLLRVYFYTLSFLEHRVAGINYKVLGTENIPNEGAFIVAAKHYSTYETMKLFLLFNDPAIILKKELLNIPFWGWYARKSDTIAIDRKNRDTAMQSILEGTEKVKNQGRPIIIFPQGTRVRPDQTPTEKPYKSGVAHMALSSGLPVIPLALNSGACWPRKSFLKYPGTVTFKFLSPIDTNKIKNKEELMHKIETVLETESDALIKSVTKQN